MHSESVAGARAAVRVLAIADTDSYLKWSARRWKRFPAPGSPPSTREVAEFSEIGGQRAPRLIFAP